MTRVSKLLELGRLARFEGGGFSVVAIFGAWAVSKGSVEPCTLGALFLANLLFLMGSCIHNDLADVKVDRKMVKLGDRPLVKGTVSRPDAMVALSVCFIGSMGIAWIVAPSLFVALALAGAILFAILYNQFSKRLFGSDLFFALSAGLLCVYGGLSVVVANGALQPPNVTLWVVAGIVVIDHFFFNAVEGGLKDFEDDGSVGAPTMARRLFVFRDNQYHLGVGAKTLFMSLKVLSALLAFLPFLLGLYPYWLWQISLLGGVVVLMLVFTWKLLNGSPLQPKRIGRLTRLQEMACRAIIPLMLARLVGVGWIVALIVLPLLWFFLFNGILHKNPFSNPKTD